MAGANERAVNATLRDLKADGSIAAVPKSLVQLCKSLARAVDSEPGNAALFREYRASLDDLRETATASLDSDAADFLISIQTPRGRATLVDAENT